VRGGDLLLDAVEQDVEAEPGPVGLAAVAPNVVSVSACLASARRSSRAQGRGGRTHKLRMCSCFWLRAVSRACVRAFEGVSSEDTAGAQERERGTHCEFTLPALELLEAGLDVCASMCGLGLLGCGAGQLVAVGGARLETGLDGGVGERVLLGRERDEEGEMSEMNEDPARAGEGGTHRVERLRVWVCERVRHGSGGRAGRRRTTCERRRRRRGDETWTGSLERAVA